MGNKAHSRRGWPVWAVVPIALSVAYPISYFAIVDRWNEFLLPPDERFVGVRGTYSDYPPLNRFLQTFYWPVREVVTRVWPPSIGF